MESSLSWLDSRYEVLSLTGEGTSSTVYRARDTQQDRLVALKAIDPRVRQHGLESIIRFRREATTLSGFHHRNLIEFLGFLEKEKELVLVLEFLDGRSLRHQIREEGYFSDDILLIVRILRQLAEGLDHAHRQGILHRDLKPSNIMVPSGGREPRDRSDGESPEIKILDFGLARLIDYSRSVEEKGVSDTFHYMAPEQAGIFRQPVDQRADLYSLGILSYELLAGELPYPGDEPGEILQQHLTRRPAPLVERNPAVPPSLSEIVERLMAKSPADRYGSARSLAGDLAVLEEALEKGERLFALAPRPAEASERLRPHVRLIERSREVEELRYCFEKARAQEGNVFLLEGEAGMGKTRLVEEFREHVVSQQGICLYGKCEEYSSKVPYHPFEEILEDLSRQNRSWPRRRREAFRTRMIRSTGEDWGPVVGLTPSVREVVGDPPSALREEAREEEGERLLESIQRFFISMAVPGSPLVLVLDDLQWAQEECLQVLLRLAEAIPRVPVMIIGLYRGEEIRRNGPAMKGIEQIRQICTRTRSERLEPLSREGVRVLVREATGASGSGFRPLYEEIHRISRGNPFFVLESLKSLLESRVLWKDPQSSSWSYDVDLLHRSPVSTNLLEVIFRRLGRLSQQTRGVLSAASAIGREFEFDLLLSIARLEEHDLLDHLDEAIHLQLVEEVRHGAQGRYRFGHDKIRQTIYERIPEEERREFHEGIGLAQERNSPGGEGSERDVFVLAHHFCNGLNSSKAQEYSIKAGNRALRQGANREAVHQYGEALQRVDDRDVETTIYLQEKLGDLHATLAGFDEALTAYQSAKGLLKTELARARIERKTGMVLNKQGDVPGAIQHLEYALRLLGKKPRKSKLSIILFVLFQLLLPLRPVGILSFFRGERRRTDSLDRNKELCRVYGDLYYLYFFSNMPRSIEADLLRLKYAERAGDPALRADAYRDHGTWLAHLRRFGKAREYLEKSLRIFERREDTWGMANTRSCLGYLDLCRGRLEEARYQIESALPELERREAQWELGTSYLYLSNIYWVTGNLRPAIEIMKKLEEQVQTGGDDRGKFFAHAGLCLTYALSGDMGNSSVSLEKTRKAFEQSPHPFISSFFHFVTGTTKLVRSDFREGRQDLEKSFRIVREHALYSYELTEPPLLLVYAHLREASEGGVAVEAGASLERARRLLNIMRFLVMGFPLYAGQWRVFRGIYLLQKGKKARAARALRKGLRILDKTGARLISGLCMDQIGFHYAATGNHVEAKKFKDEAEGVFRELGLLQIPASGRIAGATDHVHADAPPLPEAPRIEEEPALSSGDRELRSLLEASQLLNSSLNLSEVLERILDLSMTSLGAERGLLILHGDGPPTPSGDVSRPTFEMPGQVFLARNLEQQDLHEDEFILSRTLLQEVPRSGEAVVISDATKEPGFEASGGKPSLGPLSILCVPLLDQDRPTGLLYLDNRLVSQLFTEKDLSFLKSLASLAVNAIRNARAYEEIHQLKLKLQKEVEYLTEEIQTEYNFDEMIGSSTPMQEVFQFILRAAPLDQPVLIQGETGTGKELVARAIHRRSPRGRKPLIKINCAAIPEGLLESELFGYEKGAFTGASRSKAGRFELADGGTLFLDEIGEMSPALQAKLLTVLEDGEFERLGSTRTKRVDIRIIAATNRDLEQEVEQGRFRKDLYYRTKVLPVPLPPLRERAGDIPLLMAYFVDRLNKKLNKEVTSVEKHSIEAAEQYPWPGNVRELEHVVERAMALSDTSSLRLAPLISLQGQQGKTALETGASDLMPGDFHLSVDAYRRKLIREALSQAEGKKKEAARLLGLSPSNLSKMLKKLEIKE